jgi:hypothetical protein
MSNNTPHCEVCDHRIVNGVACDGPTVECPLIGTSQPRQFPQHGFDCLELVTQGGPEEFDAIRGFN